MASRSAASCPSATRWDSTSSRRRGGRSTRFSSATAGGGRVSELGITRYAAYVPGFVLAGTSFGAAAEVNGARQLRTVANHDEDSVTLAVEAACHVLVGEDDPAMLVFATSEPPYLDKSSAATVHAALGMPAAGRAIDVHGLRGGASALEIALRGGGLAVLSDLRTMPPGAPDELGHGDGAVAFLVVPSER